MSVRNDAVSQTTVDAKLPGLSGLAARLGRRPAVGIVSMSPIADDPRVRRQGDAFHELGWEVKAFGLPSKIETLPEWPILTTDDARDLPVQPSMPRTDYEPGGIRRLPVAFLKALEALAVRANRHSLAYDLRLLRVYVDAGLAEKVYWTLNGAFWDLYELSRHYKADLWLGNDWTALPIVARVAGEQGVPYVYDTHEFAAEEFNERRSWHYLQRPIRLETEGRFVRAASVVTTVSSGIAERLQAIHRLKKRPQTIRSTPGYQPMAFRPTGERIRVLYHGAVWEHRGLEECIRSVAQWRPEFDLTIRGPASDRYRSSLEAEIDKAGVRGRVDIVPAVPVTHLVREANAFDIGLFALPDHSLQNTYVLPNKFFEYTMAGLALCVSDLPEMSALIRAHGHGIVFQGVESQGIAAAINGLKPDTIDEMKRKALGAARELCWEQERTRMFQEYDVLFASGG